MNNHKSGAPPSTYYFNIKDDSINTLNSYKDYSWSLSNFDWFEADDPSYCAIDDR